MGEPEFNPLNKIVAKKYVITEHIAHGSFGEVFLGINKKTEAKVAFKFEKPTSSVKHHLKLEYDNYRLVKGSRGFPNIHFFGKLEHQSVLVMDALGPSLQALHRICSHKFSLKTVLMLADQMLRRLRGLHEVGLVHRDIKPDNFVMGGVGPHHTVYMIDLGLAQRYRNKDTNEHVPQSKKLGMCGTMTYISINAHRCALQSRRDDMEALGHILVYFLKGGLPWHKCTEKDKKKKNEIIYQKKRSMPLSELCRDLPKEFENYLNECRNLEFDAQPDYEKMRNSFRNLFKLRGYVRDYRFDWLRDEEKPK